MLLGELMIRIFKTLPGLTNITLRGRSRDEEIDLIVRNESTEPFWSRGECVIFRDKLESRGAQCRLGFFVVLGGFTEGFDSKAATYRKDPHLIVTLDRNDIDSLVNATDRNALLKQFHQRAVMTGNGH